jgi:ribose 5-phosphate isomerase B
MDEKKVIIGCDHGGYLLKTQLVEVLQEKGIEVEDVGCYNDESCDYPDFAKEVACKVKKCGCVGILVCGTGIGMSIAANKVKGIRAALVHDEYTGRMAKEHNNANIICLGGRTTSREQAIKAVLAWLHAEFQGGRHERRLSKIAELEVRECR